MEINILSVSPIGTNCYVLVSQDNKAVVVDPGGSFAHIKAYIDRRELDVKAILLTHGHHDHIGAVHELKTCTGATVYIHENDNEMLQDGELCMAHHFIDPKDYCPMSADVTVHDGDTIEVAGLRFTVMHTKGHTKGSCVYLCDDVMFAGDTLFKGSYGRTDLYGGSDSDMKDSLTRLAALEGNYTVFSGHGESTDLAYERLTNPLMGGSYDDIF